MSKKNIIARVNNFEITKDGGSEHDYLRIKSVSGHWGVTYRDDNEMYGKIMAMVRNEEYHETLQMTVLYIYYASSTLIDSEFAKDYFTALEAMRDRMAELKPNPTEEENNTAIDEVAIMEEAKKVL